MKDRQEKLGLRQVLGSVLSSFIGVQKNDNRERDFEHGRARDFILIGVLVTAAFVLLVVGVVQLVTRLAAP